jgi:hypothetical protein
MVADLRISDWPVQSNRACTDLIFLDSHDVVPSVADTGIDGAGTDESICREESMSNQKSPEIIPVDPATCNASCQSILDTNQGTGSRPELRPSFPSHS